jgi:hypothetical protein
MQPLFKPPETADGCPECKMLAERAETYRNRMKATDRRIAKLLGEQARLKDRIEWLEAGGE